MSQREIRRSHESRLWLMPGALYLISLLIGLLSRSWLPRRLGSDYQYKLVY